MTDFTILHRPRMSRAGFSLGLRAAGSPAASSAGPCYDAFVQAGVDPAVALAIFMHESAFGTTGRARANRSWGNIRDSRRPPFPYPVDGGRFRVYPSWLAGARDCARLLRIYGQNLIRPGRVTSTCRTLPYVWAPADDGNAPAAYGDALVRAVSLWSTRYPPSSSSPSTPPTSPVTRYRVRPGDSLSSIATRFHVSGGWRALWRLNRATIANPDLIYPGQLLRIR